MDIRGHMSRGFDAISGAWDSAKTKAAGKLGELAALTKPSESKAVTPKETNRTGQKPPNNLGNNPKIKQESGNVFSKAWKDLKEFISSGSKENLAAAQAEGRRIEVKGNVASHLNKKIPGPNNSFGTINPTGFGKGEHQYILRVKNDRGQGEIYFNVDLQSGKVTDGSKKVYDNLEAFINAKVK